MDVVAVIYLQNFGLCFELDRLICKLVHVVMLILCQYMLKEPACKHNVII
jgi:hypothetical protein